MCVREIIKLYPISSGHIFSFVWKINSPANFVTPEVKYETNSTYLTFVTRGNNLLTTLVIVVLQKEIARPNKYASK